MKRTAIMRFHILILKLNNCSDLQNSGQDTYFFPLLFVSATYAFK